MQSAELLPLPPMPRDNSGASVRIRKVSRALDDHRVLSNLDLEVRPGEFLSIVGKRVMAQPPETRWGRGLAAGR